MSYENMATIKETIDGVEWSVNPFPATKGIGYLKRLFKVFGESYAALTTAESEEAALQLAVSKLLENLDKDDVVDLVKCLLADVYKDGQKINFDSEFARRYGLLFKVTKFVVKENFSDFFTGNALSV